VSRNDNAQLPSSSFLTICSKNPNISSKHIFKLVNDYSPQALLTGFKILFLRAIRIASPELLTALDKWKENPASLSIKKKDALALTIEVQCKNVVSLYAFWLVWCAVGTG
jgi:hypothetical protein